MDGDKSIKEAVRRATSSFYQTKNRRKTLSRKESRKAKRQEKKVKQLKFHKKKSIKEDDNTEEKDLIKVKKKKRKRKRPTVDEENDESSEKVAYEAASRKDDLIINQLGKKLRINSKSTLPKLFSEDGLDYLLEVCDPILDGNGLADSDEEYLATKKAKKSEVKPRKLKEDLYGRESGIEEKLLFDDGTQDSDDDYNDGEDFENHEDDDFHDDNNIDDDDAVNTSDDDDDGDDGDDDDIHEDNIEVEETFSKKKNIKKEDVKGKYIPPALRNLPKVNENKEKVVKDRIRKQLKGLLNRLGESTLPGILSEVEKLYSKNSRNDMNVILYELICDACITDSTMLDQMLMEHMLLVSSLHRSVGVEVGSYFLENLAEQFDELHKRNNSESKKLRNTVLLLAYLYLFNVVHCGLIYDIVRLFYAKFTEQDVELILLVLKACGGEMRRDDPIALKEMIVSVQSKAATSDLNDRSRLRFMLEVIMALKNNNMRKIPQYDPLLIETMKKLQKSLKQGRENLNSAIQLKVSLNDLLDVKEKGRWWIVGSAWSGRGPTNSNIGTSDHVEMYDNVIEESQKLLDVAKKQHMNTNLRKNIFCTLMSSEDYVDAFERLLKLNLKEKQSREIMRVLLDCCLQEKVYNPFYTYLSDKFCQYSKSNQVTLQYAIWDRLKTLSTSSKNSSNNLAKFLSHSIATQSISLSVLKIVRFGVLDKISIRFYIKFFNILLTYPENTIIKRFKRISNQPKLTLLREGLKIFMKHFLLADNQQDGSLEYEHRKELLDKCESALDGRDYVAL